MGETRDHGGNLDAARTQYGGAAADWLDLSTGINPAPYPLPPISARAWATLPDRAAMASLIDAARAAYGTTTRIIATNGAQGAIQSIPALRPPGHAAILSPTYNEHAAVLRQNGWRVTQPETLDALAGADLAVVVNPNNPDGRAFDPQALMTLSERVGLLVVDESFVEPAPHLSLAPALTQENVVVLRSFGKFYGLAGIRLGFALAHGRAADTLARQAGPWPVSGPAIEIGRAALSDTAWQAQTTARLHDDAARLDRLAEQAGWTLAGGTPLFRTYVTPDAPAAQQALARYRVWSRIFPYSAHWLRLGLPPQDRWDQVTAALANARA